MSSDITLVSRIIIHQTAQLGVSGLAVAPPPRPPQGEQSDHEWTLPGSPFPPGKFSAPSARYPVPPPPWNAHAGQHVLLTYFWSCHLIVESLAWPCRM